MTSPSDKVAVAVEALRADARSWVAAADEMTAAAHAARRLSLDGFHFTYIGDQIGLTEVYRNLQDKLVTLLEQASANFDSTAVALTRSADTYQSEDEAGVHRLRNIY